MMIIITIYVYIHYDDDTCNLYQANYTHKDHTRMHAEDSAGTAATIWSMEGHDGVELASPRPVSKYLKHSEALFDSNYRYR